LLCFMVTESLWMKLAKRAVYFSLWPFDSIADLL
jgi:hypothetical protein